MGSHAPARLGIRYLYDGRRYGFQQQMLSSSVVWQTTDRQTNVWESHVNIDDDDDGYRPMAHGMNHAVDTCVHSPGRLTFGPTNIFTPEHDVFVPCLETTLFRPFAHCLIHARMHA